MEGLAPLRQAASQQQPPGLQASGAGCGDWRALSSISSQNNMDIYEG